MFQTFDETTTPSFGALHLPLIRQALAKQGLDGFLVPHEDEHQNEYLPAANDRLGWASGFTGSAGAAVVLADKAALFVDGRYALQAPQQVDTALFEIHDLVSAGPSVWLKAVVQAGQVIGYDPRLHSPDSLAHLRQAVEGAGGVLKAVTTNPLDAAWGGDRPPQPAAPVVPHILDHAGEASADKRRRVAQAMNADAAVLTAPSSIAWLFNVRGGDVIRTPLPLAQAILRKDGTATLFVAPAKVTPGLADWLGAEVELAAPEALEPALAALSGLVVSIDPAQSSAWYFDQLEAAGAGLSHARSLRPAPRRQERRRDRGDAQGAPPRRRRAHPLPALGRHAQRSRR
jgi:Xaa-Pro aminopeptidase